ncbi:MAG TPA: oxidoreductase [Nocardioides sp.]|uniref:oxidoreductase n=1 Tax=Nocardioides sp. TaxID=35761 RepID=UPI002F42D92F
MTRTDATWTAQDVPDQDGRVAVVTGANAGIGRETAGVLALRGATVVLACRDVAQGERAARGLRTRAGVDQQLPVVSLDLASLRSVRAAADEIRSRFSRIDLLINNAGVMAIPFQLSADGIELTFATNHLGHFALTGLLLDRLTDTRGSRVVTVSSNAHRRGEPDFEDLRSARGYRPGAAYDRSKLANVLFSFELQRRLGAALVPTVSVAAHPGNARTSLWRSSSWLERALLAPRLRFATGWLAQSAEQAALPTLRAAVDPAVRGGDYVGPAGRFGYTGPPVRVEPSHKAKDLNAQERLWQISEELTGVTYPAMGPKGAR